MDRVCDSTLGKPSQRILSYGKVKFFCNFLFYVRTEDVTTVFSIVVFGEDYYVVVVV